MENPFYDRPILNSPYDYPYRHWELDETGQPTQQVIESRRGARVHYAHSQAEAEGAGRAGDVSSNWSSTMGQGLSTAEQQYDVTAAVNEIRRYVDQWRTIPDPHNWGVTPETAQLLQHWRHHKFSHYRPFFCQVEAVETLIWLTEVAPRLGQAGRLALQRLESASLEAEPRTVAGCPEAGHGCG